MKQADDDILNLVLIGLFQKTFDALKGIIPW